MHLVAVNTLSVGDEEKMRPRKFIRAEFHIHAGASTPGPANLIVVVNHTRSGAGVMRIKGDPFRQLRFKQDVRISLVQPTMFLILSETRQFVAPPGDAD